MTGHGQPENGTNVGPAQISERVLREVFFPPFERAVQEAGAMSVMASYNEIDGVPSHVSRWLLDDVLRREWGFDGLVVDYAVPGWDGVELVQEVRNILPALPIVMVSAVADENDQARAWSAGWHDFSPNQGGAVRFESTAQAARVSFVDVPNWSGAEAPGAASRPRSG